MDSRTSSKMSFRLVLRSANNGVWASEAIEYSLAEGSIMIALPVCDLLEQAENENDTLPEDKYTAEIYADGFICGRLDFTIKKD